MAMTQEEIKDGNKLCAEFLGYKLITPQMRRFPEKWSHSYWEKKEEFDGETTRVVLGTENSLSYHSSWDWLMKVVEKLKSLEPYYPLTTDPVLELMIGVEIDVVFERCVKVIKDYNDLQG